MAKEIKITRGDVTVVASLWFDDHGKEYSGWFAEYLINGDVVDDSEKVGHDEMPTHPDAMLKATNIARDHARHLAATST